MLTGKSIIINVKRNPNYAIENLLRIENLTKYNALLNFSIEP